MSWEDLGRLAQELEAPPQPRAPILTAAVRGLFRTGAVVALILVIGWWLTMIAIGQLSVALSPPMYPNLMDTPAPRCAMGERIVDWVCTTPDPGPTVGERP